MEPLLKRYNDASTALFRRFWFQVRGDLMETGFEEEMKAEAERLGACGWLMLTPFRHYEGEIFGSLEQCNTMEQWLREYSPKKGGSVQSLSIPDTRRFLFRQRLFDTFRIAYYH